MKQLLWVTTLIACLLISFTKADARQTPPPWNSQATYVQGNLVLATNQNTYRAIATQAGHSPLTDNHTFWELYHIRTSLSLPVAPSGATFTSIQQAWAFLANATIASQATVYISVSAGTQTPFNNNFASTFSLNHQFGSQVFIRGVSPFGLVVLQFPTGAGFSLTNGHTFGGISNLVISGTNKGNTPGISVDGNSTLSSCSNVSVTQFPSGILASNHSYVHCDPGVAVFNYTYAGIEATRNSMIYCRSVVVDGYSVGQYGMISETNSSIDAEHSKCNAVNGYGYFSRGGYIDADYGLASYCSIGYFASLFATLSAETSNAVHCNYGYYAISGGKLDASYATFSSNAVDFTPAASGIDTSGSIIIR